MERADVIVVGIGAMGSSTLFHLARRGVKVIGLEQFDTPHDRGSSHGESRMIRLAYFEHPDYVPLLRRAYELWTELEKQSAEKLLHITGGLYMGRPEGEVVAGTLQAAERHDLAHEVLTRAQVAQRFPQFSIPDDYLGVWEPMAGFITPEKAIATHARLAVDMGAELKTNESVLEWSSDGNEARVKTGKGEYRAKTIIFCGGAWTQRLLRDVGVTLEVTRQVLGWMRPGAARMFELGRFPVWGVEAPDGSLSYGFPLLPNGLGLKMARHGKGTPADPERVRREIDSADEEECYEIARRCLSGADGALRHGPLNAMKVCMYTNSPDGHFILDHHPEFINIWLAAGFSGHGFKFASVIGEIMADLSLHGKTTFPVGFLGRGRFE